MGFSLSSPLYESMRCFTLARKPAVKTSHISRPGNSTYSARYSSKRITEEYLAYSVETARFSMLSTSLIRQGCPRIFDTRKTSSRQSKKCTDLSGLFSFCAPIMTIFGYFNIKLSGEVCSYRGPWGLGHQLRLPSFSPPEWSSQSERSRERPS